MKSKLTILFITIVILFTMFAMSNQFEVNSKTSTVYDETINVFTDIWYYKFVFPNGTYVTFNWDNNTNTHLTLTAGLNYLFNITNVGSYEHGMRFTNNATNAVPFNFDIKPSTTPYLDGVNFTNAGFYTVTCANYGNCGQHHAQMNFNVWVIDNTTSVSGSSGGTKTVTDIIIQTSNVTTTSNVTQYQNKNVTQTLTQISIQTQSLAGMTAIFTVLGIFVLVPLYKRRNRKN